MAKTVIVLGNGFDLSLGLPTSYHSLVESSQFLEEVEKGNRLARFLKESTRNTSNWCGLESDLLRYTKLGGNNYDFLYSDYISLKKAIKAYYLYVNNNFVCKPSIGSDVLISNYARYLQAKNSELLIINFNYTTSAKRVIYNSAGRYGGKFLKFIEIFDDFSDIISDLTGEQFSPYLKHIRVIHPHGTVEDDIIFGVNDNADIGDSIFLKKSAAKSYRPNFNWNDLNSSAEIIFYGHSLGETDHQYFNDFFFQQADINATPKKMIFYYYGETERLKLMKELDTLTRQRLGSLQMNNDIIFVDSSNNDYEITHKF